MIEYPDSYILIKINVKENNENKEVGSTLKLYSSWFGGYLGSDEWRLNSGIRKVEKSIKISEENEEYPIYKVYGYSQTIYEVGKNVGGTSWTLNNARHIFKNIPDFVEVEFICEEEKVLRIMEELSNKTARGELHV